MRPTEVRWSTRQGVRRRSRLRNGLQPLVKPGPARCPLARRKRRKRCPRDAPLQRSRVPALASPARRHQLADPPAQLRAPPLLQPKVFLPAPKQSVRQVEVAHVIWQPSPRPPLRRLEEDVVAGAVVVVVTDNVVHARAARGAPAGHGQRESSHSVGHRGASANGFREKSPNWSSKLTVRRLSLPC